MTVRRRTKGPGTVGGLFLLATILLGYLALLVLTVLAVVAVLVALGVLHHLHY